METQKADQKEAGNLDAWDYVMRGNWHLSRRGKGDIAEARRMFEAALQIDPRSAMALSGLAFALCWVNIFHWDEDLEAVRKKAYECARRTVDIDDGDAWAHAVFGWVRFSLHDLDGAIAECRRALALNPNLALAESVLSVASSWRGDNHDAIQHANIASRLSPRDPAQSMWSLALASAEFGAGNYEQVAQWARVATEAMPETPGAWRYLAASLGHLKRFEEASAAAASLLRVMPHDNLSLVRASLPSLRGERLERFIEGLRLAGLPDQRT